MILLRFWALIREASNINHLWSLLIVEEFVRLGVNQFFISPGSRSTPIVTAISRLSKAKPFVHFDERGTAFAALGYAKVTGKPAVWVTTSGTAVGNGLPAVIEAYMAGVPMILLTADRPPELRQTGANQSIPQFPVFAPYLNWSLDAPAPTIEISPSYVLTSIDQAVQRAYSNGMGPVHLNWMFREPLAPEVTGEDFSGYVSTISNWIEGSDPYTKYNRCRQHLKIGDLPDSQLEPLWEVEHGLIIAGRLKSQEEGESVREVANKLNWPLFSDISSQIRLGASTDQGQSLPLSPFIFSRDNSKHLPPPKTVIQFGKTPTSKTLLTWINTVRPENYVVIDDAPQRIDPSHTVTLRIEAEIIDSCNQILECKPAHVREQSEWIAVWNAINKKVNTRLKEYWTRPQSLSEPLIAHIISGELRDGDTLVIGNSMPIRDFDSYAVFNGVNVATITNRGASGIDGIIATAIGTAVASEGPVTAVLGDLAFLHDLNSLAMASQIKTSIVLIVINNNGGGIFSFLPIAKYTDVFEPFFGTPHSITFREAARMFNGMYHNPTLPDEFRDNYSESLATSGLSIIEVNTNRYANLQLHKEIEERIRVE